MAFSGLKKMLIFIIEVKLFGKMFISTISNTVLLGVVVNWSYAMVLRLEADGIPAEWQMLLPIWNDIIVADGKPLRQMLYLMVKYWQIL